VILKPRTLLMYGKSGVGKTSNLKMLAKWFYEKHKQKVRLVTSDGGGYEQFNDSDKLIERGIVDVFDNTNRTLALQDIHRLAEGCWTEKGELERDSNILNTAYRAKKFEKEEIGAYFVEGVESLSDVLLSHFSDQLTEGRVGFKDAWIYEEGDYKVAGLEPGHYGIVQREVHKIIVKKFEQLPVKLLVFTSKEMLGLEVTSKQKKTGEKYAVATGEPVYGPSGPGVALTTKLPGWFANCLHMESVRAKNKEGQVVDARVAWFRNHYRTMFIEGTPTDVPCLAKSSCPAERLEEMEKKFRGGYVVLDTSKGVSKYLQFLDEIGERTE
jgi:hypothetical protein